MEDTIINKVELINAIETKTGFTKKDSEKALNAIVEALTETLSTGEKIQIVGFGSFEVRNRPARMVRNPRTGDQIEIDVAKAPVFKAGKALRESVNQ